MTPFEEFKSLRFDLLKDFLLDEGVTLTGSYVASEDVLGKVTAAVFPHEWRLAGDEGGMDAACEH